MTCKEERKSRPQIGKDKIQKNKKIKHENQEEDTHWEPEPQTSFCEDPYLTSVWQNPSPQRRETAKEVHRNSDRPLTRPEKCPTQCGPRTADSRTGEYKRWLQRSIRQLLCCMTCVKPLALHNMRYRQCHSAFHLHNGIRSEATTISYKN